VSPTEFAPLPRHPLPDCRYDLERGPGHIKVTTRLALSLFGSAAAAELATAAESALEASRQAVLGLEAAAAGAVLDTVMLHWLDYEVRGRLIGSVPA
jgi:hypothetical protein